MATPTDARDPDEPSVDLDGPALLLDQPPVARPRPRRRWQWFAGLAVALVLGVAGFAVILHGRQFSVDGPVWTVDRATLAGSAGPVLLALDPDATDDTQVLTGLDLATGHRRWQRPTPGFAGVDDVGDGIVAVLARASGPTVTLVRADTGAAVGAPVPATSAIRFGALPLVLTALDRQDCGSRCRELDAVDPATGAVRWHLAFPDVDGWAADTRPGSERLVTYAVDHVTDRDPRTGEARAQWPWPAGLIPDGYQLTVPRVVGDLFVFGGGRIDHRGGGLALSAVDLATGRRAWTTTVTLTSQGEVDPARLSVVSCGTAICASDGTDLAVVDARTGTVRARLAGARLSSSAGRYLVTYVNANGRPARVSELNPGSGVLGPSLGPIDLVGALGTDEGVIGLQPATVDTRLVRVRPDGATTALGLLPGAAWSCAIVSTLLVCSQPEPGRLQAWPLPG